MINESISHIQKKENEKKGIRRIFFASHNSINGILWMLKNEAAFRQEVVLCLILSFTSFFLEINYIERLILNLSLLLVLIVEAINTAIEAVVDRVSFEHHPLSGLAKDIASASVFISLTFAAITWISIILFS